MFFGVAAAIPQEAHVRLLGAGENLRFLLEFTRFSSPEGAPNIGISTFGIRAILPVEDTPFSVLSAARR